MLRAEPLSRREMLWRIALGACALSSLGLLVGGMPIIGAVLLSPLALLRAILFGGACTIIWTIAITLRAATVAENGDRFWNTFHTTLTAVIVGLAPHAVFLMLLNHFPHRSYDPGTLPLVQWYEKNVQLLQDVVGPYLMLPFAAGVAATIFVFLIKVGLPGSRTGLWLTWSLGAARFVGLALIAATSFTVLSAAPAEGWRPNTRRVFEATWKEHVAVSAELAVTQSLISELRKPDGAFLADLRFVAGKLPRIPPDDRVLAGRRSYEETRSDRQPDFHDVFDRNTDASEPEFVRPENVEVLATANQELEVKNAAARELLSTLVGSTFGYAGEKFIGSFLSAFIEDAATRIATDTLKTRPAADAIAATLSEVHTKLSSIHLELAAAALPLIAAVKQRVQSRESFVTRLTNVAIAVVREKQVERVEAIRRRARPHGR